MSCHYVHDFIKGTTIALPHPSPVQPSAQWKFDILRPSPQAASLVSAHVMALSALRRRRARPGERH